MVETITKCLNEWNATIEALGQGKQSILIRKYGTNVDEFLLFPTVSYALKDNYLNSFQDDYKDFIKENAIQNLKLNIMQRLKKLWKNLQLELVL